MGDIVQISGNDNIVVTQLKKKLKLDSFNPEKGKKSKLVKYIADNGILGMFGRFHGENSENELVSAIKSLYKGDKSALPVSIKTIKGFTLPQVRLFLQDFLNDIGIHRNFGQMSKRRLRSHVKRFKYREMLQIPENNVQFQLVNQIVQGESKEKGKKEKLSKTVPTQEPHRPAPTPVSQAPIIVPQQTQVPQAPVIVPQAPPVDTESLLAELESRLNLTGRMADLAERQNAGLTSFQSDLQRGNDTLRSTMRQELNEIGEHIGQLVGRLTADVGRTPENTRRTAVTTLQVSEGRAGGSWRRGGAEWGKRVNKIIIKWSLSTRRS